MTFQWPLLLCTLGLVPILFGLYLLAQMRRRAYAVRFTNLALLGEVVGRGPGLRRHIPPFLFLLGVATLLVSLARPTAVIAVPRDQSAVMLVMDVSGSMRADDLKPTRMEAAKAAARSFVGALPPSVQLGVVSFNASSAVNAPLTHDRDLALRAIQGLRADGGTAIGEGLHLALDQLEARPPDRDGKTAPAYVVLLSDGSSSAGRPPAAAAERATGMGIPVYTVGIGERGATPLVDNRIPVRLDETTLQMIAAQTSAEYFYAAETTTLEKVYADIGSQIGWVEERTEVTAILSAFATLILLTGGLLSLLWFQRFP